MINRNGRFERLVLLSLLVCIGLVGAGAHVDSRGVRSASAQAADDYPLYLPMVYGQKGQLPPAEQFDLVYVDQSSAWLGSFDGRYKALLTRDVAFGAEDDLAVVRVAPDGQLVAIQQADGWAIYQRNTALLHSAIGQGFALTWAPRSAANNPPSVLLSQKGHGIDQWLMGEQQQTPLIATSDETNDHSPLWNSAGSQLAFVHHEFGTTLYLSLIDAFRSTQLPYQGENRAAGKMNEAFVVMDAVESWHDQPIALHWSANEAALIFAAKETIYVVDLATKAALTVTPPGFGTRASGRAVAVANDKILYVATGGLYVMGLDGQPGQRVVAGADLHYPQWTPDGQQIVYRGPDDRLYLVNADGTNPRIIPQTERVTQFALLP
jgi:hypothetical protein